jgi:hypothetical protein
MIMPALSRRCVWPAREAVPLPSVLAETSSECPNRVAVAAARMTLTKGATLFGRPLVNARPLGRLLWPAKNRGSVKDFFGYWTLGRLQALTLLQSLLGHSVRSLAGRPLEARGFQSGSILASKRPVCTPVLQGAGSAELGKDVAGTPPGRQPLAEEISASEGGIFPLWRRP